MQTLTDIPSYANRARSRRLPKSRAEKLAQPKGKLHGRVSEVTILGRTLAIGSPIAAIAGVACGLPVVIGLAGIFASLFGVVICVAERRAVTKY